jgi:hypothetical protein
MQRGAAFQGVAGEYINGKKCFGFCNFVCEILGYGDCVTGQRIKNYVPILDSDERQSLPGVIKSFLKLKEAPKPQRLTIEQYNKELDEAVARIDAGRFVTHDEAEKQAASWF